MRRSYSICAGVDDGRLRVAIKNVPGGSVLHLGQHCTCKAGDAIEVLTPDGRFHTPLDPANAKHYAAFAAGSGITPILSLIKTTLAREPRSRFTLLYGNRRQSSVLFHEELEDLKDRYLTRFALYNVFSREQQDVQLFNGRLDGAKVKAFADTLLPVDTIDEAFVCGPGAMIDEVEAALLDPAACPPSTFTSSASACRTAAAHHVEAGDAPHAIVTLISRRHQREVEFRRERSIDSGCRAALRASICRSPARAACAAPAAPRCCRDSVRMDKNYGLERRDLDAGYVLTCQSHPLTERVTISYDARYSAQTHDVA